MARTAKQSPPLPRELVSRIEWLTGNHAVTDSNRTVIAALRRRMWLSDWSDKAKRKRAYRVALRAHARNRKLYDAVNRGDFR